ncbi:response regulator transcription factor [Aquimarina sp. 2-A2]|uniref:response regulator transcription factor n=1 Tax=Aquimarina sp. 2-A2 TaxID=3382644 RepID=UPI00387EF510
MSIWLTLLFAVMFILPYTITNSIAIARLSFVLPLAFIALYFFWLFCKRVKAAREPCPYIRRRKDLAILSIGGITLLPIMTMLGDYQWLTFTIMNVSFYALLAIEIDRYIHSIKEKYKFLTLKVRNEKNDIKFSSLANYKLTPREIDISVSILEEKTYKTIANNFFIAERTVSKHASNIFKKTGATNRKEFHKKFSKNSV